MTAASRIDPAGSSAGNGPGTKKAVCRQPGRPSDSAACPYCGEPKARHEYVSPSSCVLSSTASAARDSEFLRGQRVMRESGAPLGEDYWYRCGACGNVSPANRWPGKSDTLTCPVCKFVHTDSDGDPGVEDGTFEELRRWISPAAQERLEREWGDRYEQDAKDEARASSAAHTPRWWTLRPEFFRTVETPSAARTTRYGFGLVKPDHTRRFLATLDRIDYDAQGHRARGFNIDVRLFG